AALAAGGAGAAAADRGPGHLAFRGYGSYDGLTALDVVVGLQDHDGFIWAASANGLYRFDGMRFRRFSVEDGLPSLLVTDMAVAPDGVLWGATSRGLFLERGERFVAIGTDVLPSDGMHLLGFEPSGVTVVTTSRGPFEIGPSGSPSAIPGWPGGESFGLLVERDGTMYVGHGARLLRRAVGATAFVDLGHDFVETISSVVRDGHGRLWVRAGQHLWMQPTADAPFEDRSPLDGAVVGPGNVRLAVGADGDLLVPTASGVVEMDGDRPHLLATDLPEDARNVKSVWVDREGSMWLTSLGLHHELGRGLWRTIAGADGLPSDVVWSITGLHDGRVAVGTDLGVALLGPAGLERITDTMATALLEQPAGALWITGPTLARYDLAGHQLRTIGAADGWTEGAPTAIAAEPDGTLWFGVDRGGLYRAAPAALPAVPRFERVALPGADAARVWAIAIDEGRVWVTTSAGLFVRDGGAWHRFGKRDGLRDDVLTFIVARRDHEVCVSYLGPLGATCVRYAGGRLTPVRELGEPEGLTSQMPYFLAEDHRGRLWIGGALGVTVVDDRGGADHFTSGGGAPGDDCNAGASWISPAGDVWIGTSTGLGVFEASRYRPAPPPAVVIASGHLGAAAMDLDAWRSSGRRTVAYSHGHLDAELAALSYLDARQLEYQVMLVGFDESWRASDGDDIRYHHLPAGAYRFTARARYHGGAWGPAVSFAFVVATPWWQTWWFRALAGASVVALGIALARWRSRALVARNVELEATVRERTAELVHANEKIAQAEKLSALGRLLAQLSHEINNPLNVVHNNLGPLEEYSHALTTAARRCRELVAGAGDGAGAAVDALWQELDLQYVIDDSGPAFESTRHAISRIAAINGELKTFLRGEPIARDLVDVAASVRTTVAMFARTLPDVELVCDLPALPRVMLHEGRFNQTVTNLLQNAADAMERRGRIAVTADVDEAFVRLRIHDSGPGVPEAVRARIFEPFFTTKDVGKGMGLGLAICREIIAAHGGTLELDEQVTAGACFVLSLPRPAAAAAAAAHVPLGRAA
ncbi:MAG TPA: ATP-binding protein, partial [Kofleriaceae bacterium]|nr:ATP-binding protein [Kofleriaceae bacterium]